MILNLAGESSLIVFHLFVSQPSLSVYSICRFAPHGKSVIKTKRLNLVYHLIGCCWLWTDFTIVLVSFFIDISQHFFWLILPQRRRYWILNPPLLEVRATYYCNFKLITDLLDSIELGSWFQISVPRIFAKFVPWNVDLAGGRKSSAAFLRLYGTSLTMKKCQMNLGLVVTVFFCKFPLIKTTNVAGEHSLHSSKLQ